jgi:hypothetical protein
MAAYATIGKIKNFQSFTMIYRKPHMASSICLRATIFKQPEGTLWTHCILFFRRGYLVGVIQSVTRRTTDWTAGVRFLEGARDSSLFHSVQTSSGAHPASYPIGTGGCPPGGKVVHVKTEAWRGNES